MSTKVNYFMLSFFFSSWVLEAVPPTNTISTCSKIATAISQSHLPIAQAPPQMWGLHFNQDTGIKEESSCIVSIKIHQKNASCHFFFLMETTSKSLEFGQLLQSKAAVTSEAARPFADTSKTFELL